VLAVAGYAERVNRADVRVIEPGGGPGLLLEATDSGRIKAGPSSRYRWTSSEPRSAVAPCAQRASSATLLRVSFAALRDSSMSCGAITCVDEEKSKKLDTPVASTQTDGGNDGWIGYASHCQNRFSHLHPCNDWSFSNSHSRRAKGARPNA
jgi:hypothetical protein